MVKLVPKDVILAQNFVDAQEHNRVEKGSECWAEWKPSPAQLEYLRRDDHEILFGGVSGGGKASLLEALVAPSSVDGSVIPQTE